jgi:hypothetical protein
MTNHPPDPDIRALFQALRRADEEHLPPFRRVMEAGTVVTEHPSSPGGRNWIARRPLRRLLALGGTLLAAAAAAILLLLPRSGVSEAEFESVVRTYTASPAGGAWRSPTDALLRLPGNKVLNTLPSLGGGPLPGRSTTRSPSNQT